MLKRGRSPYLECSTRGGPIGQQLSAFKAKIAGRNNQSIETIYQASKIFEDGTTGLHWKQAKGRLAVNQTACTALYEALWRTYMDQHPELWKPIEEATGLCDMFGKEGSVCQADILWKMRCIRLSEKYGHSIVHQATPNKEFCDYCGHSLSNEKDMAETCSGNLEGRDCPDHPDTKCITGCWEICVVDYKRLMIDE